MIRATLSAPSGDTWVYLDPLDIPTSLRARWEILAEARRRDLGSEAELVLEADDLALPEGHAWARMRSPVYVHPGEDLEACVRGADAQLNGPGALTSPVFFDSEAEEAFARAAMDLVFKAMVSPRDARPTATAGWPDIAD